MNDIIYNWLYNSYNNDKSISTTLIECILILSINNMPIEYDKIIEYYYKIIQLNQNNTAINNNNYNNNEISLLNGLNKQQFQILHNNINSLIDIFNNSSTTSSTTLPHPKNNASISNNNDNDDEINKTKFEYSIFLINQNNLKNSQSKQNYNNNNINKHSIQNKKTFICDCGIGTSLFLKVWRNIVIRNEILNHTRLFNMHYNKLTSLHVTQLSTYRFKEYIDHLSINIQDETFIVDINSIPQNLRTILFYSTNKAGNVLLKPNALPDTLTSVEFDRISISNEILDNNNLFPNSITSLKFDRLMKGSIKQPISKSWLPNSLKTLHVIGNDSSVNPTISKLPESLTELNIPYNYNGIIEPFSVPSSVKTSYKFNSNKQISSNSPIPLSTINLEFDNDFDQVIKVGDIPKNVKSIIFSEMFNSNIEFGSLPLSLLSLKFIGWFDRVIGENVIPSNLTYIGMSRFDQPLTPNLFPKSITTIDLASFDQPIPDEYFINHVNLKTLNLTSYQTLITTVKTLPPNLTSLELSNYEKPIMKVFPESLTKLEINSPYQIQPNTFPESLTSLEINIQTEDTLVPGSLPCNLKELRLNYFEQDISVDGILPKSIQSIYIPSYRPTLLNCFSTDFILKYIRFSDLQK